MSKQKVTLRIEEGEVELIKVKFNTYNLSEAIRLSIMQSLATEDFEKVKTLFPYIGKKPLRIGKEVVNAFEQTGCEIFVDLFCGSIAMLCYLPWDVKHDKRMNNYVLQIFFFLFFNYLTLLPKSALVPDQLQSIFSSSTVFFLLAIILLSLIY